MPAKGRPLLEEALGVRIDLLPSLLPEMPGVSLELCLLCLVASLSVVFKKTLRNQALYFIHSDVLPGPRREVQMFHADRDKQSSQDAESRAWF